MKKIHFRIKTDDCFWASAFSYTLLGLISSYPTMSFEFISDHPYMKPFCQISTRKHPEAEIVDLSLPLSEEECAELERLSREKQSLELLESHGIELPEDQTIGVLPVDRLAAAYFMFRYRVNASYGYYAPEVKPANYPAKFLIEKEEFRNWAQTFANAYGYTGNIVALQDIPIDQHLSVLRDRSVCMFLEPGSPLVSWARGWFKNFDQIESAPTAIILIEEKGTLDQMRKSPNWGKSVYDKLDEKDGRIEAVGKNWAEREKYGFDYIKWQRARNKKEEGS